MQAFLKHYVDDRFDAQSAGLEPRARLNPLGRGGNGRDQHRHFAESNQKRFHVWKSGEVFSTSSPYATRKQPRNVQSSRDSQNVYIGHFTTRQKSPARYEQKLQKVREIRDEIASKIQDWLASLPVEQSPKYVGYHFDEADAIHPAQSRMSQPSRFGDKAFYWLTLSMAFAVVLLVILIGWELGQGSWQAIQKFGFRFLTASTWDPVAEEFGALPFIYGTAVSSLIALLIAVPLSIATAVYLTELAPLWIRQPIVSLDRDAGRDPQRNSRVVGNFRHDPVAARLSVSVPERTLGWTPFFSGPIYGPCMLAGGIIVAIMILPIITSVSREILRSVPDLQREAAYALGATRWEVTRIAVLSYAEERFVRRGDTRARPCAGRNDGGDDGDR